jgi:hypothetical protein
MLEGPLKRWWPNGNLHVEGQYKSGREDGQWTHYYPGGEKESAGSYRDGQRDGTWVLWDKPGTPPREVVYISGRLIANFNQRLAQWENALLHGDLRSAFVAARRLEVCGQRCIPVLEKGLEKGRLETKLLCLQTLSKIGLDAKSSLAKIEKLKDDPDERVMMRARVAIVELDPKQRDAELAYLLQLLAESEGRTRQRLLGILAKLSDGVLSAFEALLAHPDEAMCIAAIDVMEAMSSDSSISAPRKTKLVELWNIAEQNTNEAVQARVEKVPEGYRFDFQFRCLPVVG